MTTATNATTSSDPFPPTSNDDDHKKYGVAKSDSIGRLQSSITSSKGGRGSLVGWTRCPLCLRHKLFANGRGIATHFHEVHTPWKPGKAEKRRRQKLRRARRFNLESTILPDTLQNLPVFQMNHWFVNRPLKGRDEVDEWEPTHAERQQWDEQVLSMVKALEDETSNNQHATVGLDRHGRPAKSYRESLPPLHTAAAEGDIEQMKRLLASPEGPGLLQSRDRNGSYAEHWAAGEGYLECLQFLLSQTQSNDLNQKGEGPGEDLTTPASTNVPPDRKHKAPRRRDGKTCLHYASRFGKLDVVKYLVSISYSPIDDPSGEGTTAFHLACFGGFVETARFLKASGADPFRRNEWNCQASHWVAMYKGSKDAADCPDDDAGVGNGKSPLDQHKSGKEEDPNVLAVCRFLKDECGLDFCAFQKQGHCALHKAAQAKNYDVIRWMSETLTESEKLTAGQADAGGHLPSDILASVGGNKGFVQWMKETQGW